MKLYQHKTWRGLPCWGIWDRPYRERDAVLVATVIRLHGMYCPVLTQDRGGDILKVCYTLRGAKRVISESLSSKS